MSPETQAERRLWAAVLRQAVRDACAPDATITPAQRDDAREFLTTPARLAPVCALLDLDPAWMQAQLAHHYPQLWMVPAPQVPPFTDLRQEVLWIRW